LRWLPILPDYDVQWLEEPLRPEDEVYLEQLRAESQTPLAGGENILMPPGSDVDEIAASAWDILQPDLTKYTPLHVAQRLLDAAGAAGKRLIPHFLGSGPGQAASLHFAAGCPEGLLELDISPNPLRTETLDSPLRIVDGSIEIPQRPGLGWRLATPYAG
jgi:D-galactarolactone cycloisomerase